MGTESGFEFLLEANTQQASFASVSGLSECLIDSVIVCVVSTLIIGASKLFCLCPIRMSHFVLHPIHCS